MSMFANAKKVETKTTTKKSNKEQVEVVGLEELASIKVVQKMLEGVVEGVEADVKEQMKNHFVKTGMEAKNKPSSFTGVEGDASASCEFRKRSTRSTLTDDDVALLQDHGVSFETVEDQTETFIINPEYKDDQELLAKVEKALKGVKGLPEDFIMLQTGKTRHVVSDETVKQVFEKKNSNVVSRLIAVVGTFAVKPKMDNVEKAFDLVKEMVEA